MRLQIDGLNLHYKFKFKKPLGGGSSFVRDIIKHPGYAAAAPFTGGLSLLGNAVGEHNTTVGNNGANNNPGGDPGAADQSLIEAKYNQLASGYQDSANPLRAKLATSLSDYAKGTFEQENPFILQDLNARGLGTSPSAVTGAQTSALKDLSLANAGELNNFDTDVFNQVQNLKTTGVGTGLQRLFDMHDQAAQAALAKSLAKRRSRDSLYGAGIGAVGSIAGAAIRGGYGGGGGGGGGGGYGSNGGYSGDSGYDYGNA